jgi:hypothetical protein
MHRSLPIHQALVATATVVFSKCAALKKKPVVNRAAKYIMCGNYRKAVYLLLRAVFPLLLHITASNIPGMDKLYYLTFQTIAAVKKSRDSLGDTVLFSDLTLDTVALDDVSDNDPGSDTDEGEDNNIP